MASQPNEIDNTIGLLRKLIEKSPADSQHRLRLLKILYNERRKSEFVEEAFMYMANCDLRFDTGWDEVCSMGRIIDPGNGHFGKATPGEKAAVRNGRPAAAPSRTTPVADPPQESGPGRIEPQTEPLDQTGSAPTDGSERRQQSDRRKADRRMIFSVWFGEERRGHTRRQRRRRSKDNVKR